MRFAMLLLVVLLPCSLRAQTATADTELTAVVEALKRTWNSEDLEGMLSHFTTDAVVVASGTELKGIQAFRQYLTRFFAIASKQDWRPVVHSVWKPSASQAVILLKAENSQMVGDRLDVASGFHTLVLERRANAWKVVHEHWSYVSRPEMKSQ